MRTCLTIIFLCWIGSLSHAQSNYREAIKMGDDAFKKGDYQQAMNLYFAAEAFDPGKKEDVKNKVVAVFERIEKLKEEADLANQTAQLEKEKAQQQALTSYANDLAYKSKNALMEGDLIGAIRLAKFAQDYLVEDNDLAIKSLTEALNSNFKGETQNLFLEKSLIGHLGEISSISFSGDGSYLATGSADGTVRYWNLSNGKLESVWDRGLSHIENISISSEGQLEVIGFKESSLVRFLESQQTLLATEVKSPREIRNIAVSANGRFVSFVSKGTTIKIWDANLLDLTTISTMTEEGGVSGNENTKSPFPQSDFDQSNRNISSLAFSMDGHQLAVGFSTGSIEMWDVQKKTYLKSFKADTVSISGLVFSSDGKLATISSNRLYTKIWDLKSCDLLANLNAESSIISSVKFSPNNKYLVTGSDQGEAILWDASTGNSVATLKSVYSSQFDPEQYENLNAVKSISFSSDGKYLATGHGTGIAKVWDLNTNLSFDVLPGHNDVVSKLKFSQNGDFLVSGSWDGAIKLWDIERTEVLRSSNYQSDKSGVITLSYPDSILKESDFQNYIRTSGNISNVRLKIDSTSRVGDTISFISDDALVSDDFSRIEFLSRTSTGLGPVYDFDISPDGKEIALLGYDFILWNVEEDTFKRVVKRDGFDAAAVIFKSNGLIPVAIKWKSFEPSIQSKIGIWNLVNGNMISVLDYIGDPYNVTFFPSKDKIALVDSTGSSIFDIQSGRLVNQIVNSDFSSSYINLTQISSDEKRIGSSLNEELRAAVWNLDTGSILMKFGKHNYEVTSTAFSSDGKKFISSSRDGSIKLWNTEKGSLIAGFEIESGMATSLAYSPIEKTIAVGLNDGRIMIWELDGRRILKRLRDMGYYSALSFTQLKEYGLNNLISVKSENELKLISSNDLWQIKAFADLAAFDAGNSITLEDAEPHYERANRLYIAALEIQNEILLKREYAKMLRNWADVYESNGMEGKAREKREKADGIWDKE